MKTLIVFALAVAGMSQLVSGYWAGHWAGPLAAPVVTPTGFLADTPEVAAAKAAHFAKLAAAGAPVPPGFLGVYGAPVLTPAGFLADTPEVAAAKAAHLAELAKAGGAVPYAPAYGADGAYVPDANGW